jgi:anti-sigma factor RsiW
MECRDTERLIDPFLDRELSEADSTELQAHLARCTTCRKNYGRLVAALENPTPVDVPEGLRDRIVAAIETTQRDGSMSTPRDAGITGAGERRWPAWLPWSGALAACITFFFVGWFGSTAWNTGTDLHSDGPPNEPVQIVITPWTATAMAQAVIPQHQANPLMSMVMVAAMEASFEPVATESAIEVPRTRIFESPPDIQPIVPGEESMPIWPQPLPIGPLPGRSIGV